MGEVVLPLVYFLLKGKFKQVYIRALSQLLCELKELSKVENPFSSLGSSSSKSKGKKPEVSPLEDFKRQVLVDFEEGEGAAFDEVFGSDIISCFYHFR